MMEYECCVQGSCDPDARLPPPAPIHHVTRRTDRGVQIKLEMRIKIQVQYRTALWSDCTPPSHSQPEPHFLFFSIMTAVHCRTVMSLETCNRERAVVGRKQPLKQRCIISRQKIATVLVVKPVKWSLHVWLETPSVCFPWHLNAVNGMYLTLKCSTAPQPSSKSGQRSVSDRNNLKNTPWSLRELKI